MQWLVRQLGDGFSVERAEDYRVGSRDVYRFFELFDLAQIKHWEELAYEAKKGKIRVEAPFKPWLEEKLWLALFHHPALKSLWRQELRENHQKALQRHIPQGWVVDPTPVPPHAVLPGLEIQRWEELGAFSQRERRLVLKLSGFSDQAWGSRSVVVGHDLDQATWRMAVQRAEQDFSAQPWILQRFWETRLVEHPYYQPDGSVAMQQGRVRLCPYYFTPRGSKDAVLGGILATIVPADKKVIHGMEDAILVPCARG
jgi:hypothetical protein